MSAAVYPLPADRAPGDLEVADAFSLVLSEVFGLPRPVGDDFAELRRLVREFVGSAYVPAPERFADDNGRVLNAPDGACPRCEQFDRLTDLGQRPGENVRVLHCGRCDRRFTVAVTIGGGPR